MKWVFVAESNGSELIYTSDYNCVNPSCIKSHLFGQLSSLGYLCVAKNKTNWIVKVPKTKYTMKDFKCKEQFCCKKNRQQSIAGGNCLVWYYKRVIKWCYNKV